MSYALGATAIESPRRYAAGRYAASRFGRPAPRKYTAYVAGFGDVSPGSGPAPVTVGTAASKDPILAKASLEASQVLRAATTLPITKRQAFVDATLNSRYGSGTARKAKQKTDELLARKVSRDQAIFDGMRITIANYYFDAAVKTIKGVLAGKRPAVAGLGSLGGTDDGKTAACIALAAGGGVVGGLMSLIPGVGGAGGAVSGATGQIQNTLDCSGTQQTARETAAAAAAAAQANAQAAQANAQASQTQSAAQLEAERERNATFLKLGLIGAGVVGVLGVGYMVFRK